MSYVQNGTIIPPVVFCKRKLKIVNYSAKNAPLDQLQQYGWMLSRDEAINQNKDWSPSEGVTFALMGSKVLTGISYNRRVTRHGIELVFSGLSTLLMQGELSATVVTASIRAEEIRAEYEPVNASVLIDVQQDGKFNEEDAAAFSYNGLRPKNLTFNFEGGDLPIGLAMSAAPEEMQMAQSAFANEWEA